MIEILLIQVSGMKFIDFFFFFLRNMKFIDLRIKLRMKL